MLWVVRGDDRRATILPGILAPVDFGGRLIHTAVGSVSGTGRPLHESLGMGGVRGQARAVAAPRGLSRRARR